MTSNTTLFREEQECCICLEALPKIGKDGVPEDCTCQGLGCLLDIAKLVKCGHIFHKTCLDRHEELISNAKCPLCRTELVNDRGEIMAQTTNCGGHLGYINLLHHFLDDRFYRDNPDIAKQEAMAAGEDVDLIQDLIEEGVDVNSTFPEGTTGLMFAIWNGRLPEIRCFIENNANVNFVSHYGETAMDASDEASHNKQEIVALLEQAGALRKQEICAHCGVTSKARPPPQMQRCSRCKKIYYCSRDCQRKHWKGKHKEHCSP